LLIITADFGTFYFGKKLLEKLKLPAHHIFWYLLNPFIIIELTGNLHFEGVMIFFIVWSLYLLEMGKWRWSAVAFSLSVLVKLIPLLLIPIFFQKLKTTKSLVFVSIVCITIMVSFIPFFSLEFITKFTETTALWFYNFEFNASVFYLVRAIGYFFVDFNIIQYYGWFLIAFLPIAIPILFYKRKLKIDMQDIITTMLFTISLYYAVATTVHPWYIAVPLILSVFTYYKFPIVWSLAIMLSYGAYGNNHVTENFWMISIEYVVVYTFFIYEVILKKHIRI